MFVMSLLPPALVTDEEFKAFCLAMRARQRLNRAPSPERPQPSSELEKRGRQKKGRPPKHDIAQLLAAWTQFRQDHPHGSSRDFCRLQRLSERTWRHLRTNNPKEIT